MTRLHLSAKCNIKYEFITMLQRFSIKYLIFISTYLILQVDFGQTGEIGRSQKADH